MDFILEEWVSNEKLVEKLVNVILSLLIIPFTSLGLLGLETNVMNELLLNLILDVFPRKVW
jgi:hypothetical protein